jgi:Flp pilus assembly protein TadG
MPVTAMKTIWTKFRSALREFRVARAGNVAITFAFATIPVIGAVGAGFDYSHANSVKADLQAALDSTALMLAKDAATTTAADLNTKAMNYFTALFNRPNEASINSVSATYTATAGSQVVVNGSVNVPTTFIRVLGASSLQNVTVTGSSTTKWGSTRLRVALVLDNTGSMADDGKMTALKSATHSLLTQLQAAAGTNGDVYVSIVPFSKDVNVGTSNNTATWIDWTDWNAANGGSGSTSSMYGSICYNGTLYRVSGSSWITGGSCRNAAGICYNGSLYQYNGNFYVAGTCNNNSAHSNWNGCVTDRGPSGNSTSPGTSTYDQTVAPPVTGTPYSLYPAEQYSACPVAMKQLSYDWTSMNSLVDSMQPNGNTNQAIGLVWGWMTLAGGGVFTIPTMDSNYTYNKVIILLSDGLNTEDSWYVAQTPIDNRMYNTGNGTGTCANIKAAGITIYTIQVNTGGDPTSMLLRNCASSSDKFFMLTSASGIATVFNQIGTNLTKLRVAR